MINIENLTNLYYVNMQDVPYELSKGGTIFIKPILLKDYSIYNWAIECLSIDKNQISDIEIIQMSYLEFLIQKLFKQSTDMENKLRVILNLSLGEDYIGFGDNYIMVCEKNDSEEPTIKYLINSSEFEDISKIILSQNDINYDDRIVNPEVKELAEEYYKVKFRDVVTPSLEKRKAFVCSKIGKTFKELGELPYREFELIYDACKDSEMYFGNKIIQGSYKYDVKEDIPHPLFEKKKDLYDELFKDASTLENKGISGANKLNAENIKNMLD